jgi:hypothetical protein
MTDQIMNPHATFRDNLDIYLSGSLSPDETTAFEAHATACPQCAANLATAQKSDQTMRSLFAPLAPAADFEDRLIASLRKPPTIRRLHPMVRLAASGVAAAVVLGAVGFYGGRLVNKPRYAEAKANSLVAAETEANLKQAGEMGQLYVAKDDLAFGVTNSPSADDWAYRNGGDQDKISGSNRDRNHRSDFDFFYQSKTAGEVTNDFGLDTRKAGKDATIVTGLAVAQHAIQKLPGQKSADYKKQFDDQLSASLENAGKLDKEKRLPDNILKYPPNWPDISEIRDASARASNSYSEGTVGGTMLGDGHISGENDKLAEADQKRTLLEHGSTSPEHKLGTENFKEPALVAAAQSSAPVPAGSGDIVAVPPTTQSSITTSAAAAQKIIRTGAMEFEVDSFDSAFLRITKIAAEESAFVASTDSDKLENGKVKGTVTLRCPPEHLDTLVLKLRGLGDLKTQRITAQDVTKQFTDYESQLRAARAMEERLLDIIKTGKGAVKDLVEAEKQLGIYREKIEHIEGELRYMGSQVALSTLSVSLMERDIRTPFAAVEAEQISAGIEAEDVERARAEALKLIDDAKGRVIESELKKLDAGQLAATLVADVSPDAAGPLGDRLKQLGRVARWEATRKQTTEGGSGVPTPLQPNLKLQRQPTRFSVSIYNLANVAPRQITSLTLVSDDVEAAYRSILAAMNGDPKTPAIGRIVTSNLSAQKSDQVTGSITLEVKSDQTPVIEAALRTAGSVMHLTVTENPDQNGVTDAKRGYGITIIAAANVPAREQQTITVASKDVGATYNKLLAMLRDPKASARVINSQLTEPEEDNITGSVDFEIPIANRPAVDALLSDQKQSDVISRNVIRSADTENTLAEKLHLTVSIGSAERLPPRETTRLTLQTADVPKALETAAALSQSDAHVTERSLSQQPDGRSTAHLAIDVPLSAAQATLDQLRSLGKVASAESARDAKVTAGPLARARFEVELENAQTLVPPQDGMSASIQRGLRTALNGLLWSVQMVVVGLVLVGPFALVIWVTWRLIRRGKNKAATSPGGA